MASLTFVVLTAIVCTFAVEAADHVCKDINELTERVVDTWDITQEEVDLYFCYQSVVEPTVNYCKFTLKKAGTNTSEVEGFYYDLTSNEKGSDKYKTKTVGRAGIYEDDMASPKVTCYVTGVDANKECMSYVECYSGGQWGGKPTEGAFFGVICRKPEQCETTGKSMAEEITKEFLSDGPELEKIDHHKCKEAGVEFPKEE